MDSVMIPTSMIPKTNVVAFYYKKKNEYGFDEKGPWITLFSYVLSDKENIYLNLKQKEHFKFRVPGKLSYTSEWRLDLEEKDSDGRNKTALYLQYVTTSGKGFIRKITCKDDVCAICSNCLACVIDERKDKECVMVVDYELVNQLFPAALDKVDWIETENSGREQVKTKDEV
jgi:hypothetical protein